MAYCNNKTLQSKLLKAAMKKCFSVFLYSDNNSSIVRSSSG